MTPGNLHRDHLAQGFPHSLGKRRPRVAAVSQYALHFIQAAFAALQAFERYKYRLNRVQSLLADSGYTGQPFA